MESTEIKNGHKPKFSNNAHHSSVVNLHIVEKENSDKSKIPDGGWGWFVVLAGLYVNLVADGAVCSFGFLYVHFLEEFGASKSVTSWIGSLFVAVPLLAGPLCSSLVDRYGCRKMTIAGALVCTVGFVLSSYAQSIAVLMITFGVIGGIGLGLGYVTAVVAIAFWFEKKRTLALGLAASGTGFGTIVYSPLVSFLLNEYGWRGTVLILGGFFTNLCVAGCLMREPDWMSEENGKDEAKKLKAEIDHSSSPTRKKEDHVNKNNIMGDGFRSVVNLPTYFESHKEVPNETIQNVTRNKQMYNITSKNYPEFIKTSSNSVEEYKTDEKVPDNESRQNDYSEQNVALLKNSVKAKNSDVVDVLVRKNSIAYRGAVVNIHNHKLISAASCPDLYHNSSPYDENQGNAEDMDEIRGLTHFSLFLNFHFFLMSLVTVIVNIWFIVPFFYLAAHMLSHGYTDSDVAVSFLANGIMTIVGMFTISWIGDKYDTSKLYAICLTGCGLSCGALMLFTDLYWLLIISSAFFGLFFSSIFSLTPAILAKLVPLENFTMAYGLNLLCHGIGNLTGPPIAGLLFDLTHSYAQSFYQACFWMIFSGILVALIAFTKNRIIFGFLRRK